MPDLGLGWLAAHEAGSSCWLQAGIVGRLSDCCIPGTVYGDGCDDGSQYAEFIGGQDLCVACDNDASNDVDDDDDVADAVADDDDSEAAAAAAEEEDNAAMSLLLDKFSITDDN